MGNYGELIMRWGKFGVVKKGMILLGGLGLVWFGWWASDIPIGYYKFRMICQKEGGIKSFGVVDPKLGWEVDSKEEAKEISSQYPSVPFVRFRSESGSFSDIRYVGGNPWWDTSYVIGGVGDDGEVGYRWERKAEKVKEGIRLRKEVSVLKDIASGRAVFVFNRFVFTVTNPGTTWTGMSDVISCPKYYDGVSFVRAFLEHGD